MPFVVADWDELARARPFEAYPDTRAAKVVSNCNRVECRRWRSLVQRGCLRGMRASEEAQESDNSP